MTRKTINRFILGVLLLISTQLALASGELNMLSQSAKPFFRVVYDLSGCSYELRMNDVPIEQNHDGLPISSWAPANAWMHNGDNTISIYLLPTQETATRDKCRANVKLVIGGIDSPKDKDIPIMSISYQGNSDNLTNKMNQLHDNSTLIQLDSKNNFATSDMGNVKVGKINVEKITNQYGSGIKISRTINMDVPFPRWKWLDSDNIPNNEETKAELIKQYHHIWRLLKNKDIHKLVPLFEEKTREVSAATYANNSAEKLTSDLQSETSNPLYELGDDIATVPTKYLHLQIFGDGKLARLVTWDGGAVIFFNYKNGSGSDSYNIIFRKQDGKWIITR